MRDIALVIVVKLPTIFAIGAAAWLAFNNKEGWGWFLFVAVLITSSVKIDD